MGCACEDGIRMRLGRGRYKGPPLDEQFPIIPISATPNNTNTNHSNSTWTLMDPPPTSTRLTFRHKAAKVLDTITCLLRRPSLLFVRRSRSSRSRGRRQGGNPEANVRDTDFPWSLSYLALSSLAPALYPVAPIPIRYGSGFVQGFMN